MRIVTGGSGAFLLLALLLSAGPASAQQPGAQPEPASTPRPVSLAAFGLLYTGFDTFYDPPSESRWVLADAAWGGGVGLHVELGGLVLLGGEAAVSRTAYERRPRSGSTVLGRGNATVTSALLSGRLSSAGLGIPRIPGVPGPRGGRSAREEGFDTYLSAALGAVSFRLEDLDDRSSDLTFAAGGGLSYAWQSGRTIFVEWKRFWIFHERDGVESGIASQSRIELGGRVPIRG